MIIASLPIKKEWFYWTVLLHVQSNLQFLLQQLSFTCDLWQSTSVDCPTLEFGGYGDTSSVLVLLPKLQITTAVTERWLVETLAKFISSSLHQGEPKRSSLPPPSPKADSLLGTDWELSVLSGSSILEIGLLRTHRESWAMAELLTWSFILGSNSETGINSKRQLWVSNCVLGFKINLDEALFWGVEIGLQGLLKGQE